MKKNFYIFNIIIICFFIIFTVANLFISNGEYSHLENRYLQGTPEFTVEKLLDRTYMNEIENYSNDQLMFRDFFIKLKAGTEKMLGKKENNGVYFSNGGYLIEDPADYDIEFVSKNIDSIRKLNEKGLFDVAACIIPQSYEILKDELPDGAYRNDVYEFMSEFSKNMKDADIKFVNPTETLNQHKDEYIFYRLDHHQTSDGSYLIYDLLGNICGFNPDTKESFKKETVSKDFYGTMYSKGLNASEPDTIYAYKSDTNSGAKIEFYGEDKKSDSIFFENHLDEKDKYSYFLDGNHGLTIISGGADNGKKIALFKDSYAHSIAPFLINHYESIHLIDMRYFNENPISYIAENGIEQVLFLYGSSTFMTDETISKIGRYADETQIARYGLVDERKAVTDEYFSDALFLGDSLTVGFQSYSGLVDATFLCRTSMSVGGVFNAEADGTSLVEKVKAASPGKIYVMLGVNEYIAISNKDAVMSKFDTLIDRLKSDNPDSVIYLQSILPMSQTKEGRSRTSNEVIYDFNNTLMQMAEEKEIYYIDVFKAVTDENGYLIADLTGDGIHLNEEGCKLWTDYLRTHAIGGTSVNKADKSDKDNKKSDFKQGKYNLEAIADKIKKEVSFEGDVGDTNPKVLLQTHNIEPDKTVNAYGCVGGGATAEEIALFEVKDSAQISKLENSLREYIDTRIKSFESYIPKEVPKLRSAVIYSKDNFIALVIADDTGNITDVLDNAVK